MDIATAVQQSQKRAGFPETIDYQGLKTLPDILACAVEKYGDLAALSVLGHTISYRELDELSSHFAGWLQRSTTLKPGDRLAIQLPNLSQYAIVAYGALKAGLVLVNVNPMYTERELKYQFEHAEVRAVVVFDQFLEHVEAVVPETPVEQVIVVSPFDLHAGWKYHTMSLLLRVMGKSGRIKNGSGKYSKLRDILSSGNPSEYQPVQRCAEDMAVLQYTGGTTGVSKPAILSHHNLVSNILQSWYGLQPAGIESGVERMVAPLPLYHIYSFTLVMGVGLHIGAHTLLIPDPRNISNFLKQLRQFPFSFLSGLNTLFLALLKHPGFNKVDFSATKIATSGGMALTEGVATEWRQRTGVAICEGYGLTETSPVVAVTPANAVVNGAVGLMVPETEARIVSPQGEDMPTGEHGELWVRGPQVMSSYWQFPEETANVMAVDGWFKTGDIASIDEQGYLRIHDRMKDMILVSGFNVYPNEVEGVLSTHPDITHCAAIGVSDPESGEVVKVFVVSTNPNLTADDIRAFCKEQLASYKVPKLVEFRDELPLSNVGKVLRKELRE